MHESKFAKRFHHIWSELCCGPLALIEPKRTDGRTDEVIAHRNGGGGRGKSMASDRGRGAQAGWRAGVSRNAILQLISSRASAYLPLASFPILCSIPSSKF